MEVEYLRICINIVNINYFNFFQMKTESFVVCQPQTSIQKVLHKFCMKIRNMGERSKLNLS